MTEPTDEQVIAALVGGRLDPAVDQLVDRLIGGDEFTDPDPNRCEIITDPDTGEVARVRVSPNLSDRGREALREIIAAARRHHAKLHPDSKGGEQCEPTS